MSNPAEIAEDAALNAVECWMELDKKLGTIGSSLEHFLQRVAFGDAEFGYEFMEDWLNAVAQTREAHECELAYQNADKLANADGTPASGTVRATLTKTITNANFTVVPSSVTKALDKDGLLSMSLWSNLDPDTVPQDSQWRVDFEIQGGQPEQYFITVPVSSDDVELGTLLPGGHV